jgi:hypothetical protein
MKTLTLIFCCLSIAIGSVKAGGGSEEIVAEINGWTIRISSGGGSDGYIEKDEGGIHYSGRIGFQYFWDYYMVLKSFPRSPANKKTALWIADENNADEPNPAYLDPSRALPLFHLMLLNHRTKISSDNPEQLEQELNANSPLPKELIPNANFKFKVHPHKLEKDQYGNAVYVYPE